jgi:hypothetical protein
MAAAPVDDPWHFPRPALAATYLRGFELGLVAAKGLFAKRRFGKSEFLEKDLIPAARVAGYQTVYVNLWENRTDPAGALLQALADELKPTGWRKVLKDFQMPVKKLKAGGKVAGVAEGTLEAELETSAQPSGPALSNLLKTFDKSGRKLLLVLDEAQVLADANHSNLAHALRAALDMRKQTIKVVFAGSSETTLRRMFGRASEPFYNWAPLEPFELLGDAFVAAMVKRTNLISRFPLKEEEALVAFETLNRTPEFFRRYLAAYLTNPERGSTSALEATLTHVFSDETFANYWKSLLPADREVLKLLAGGETELHGADARERLGKSLGLDKPAGANTAYHSLRRLQDDGTVAKVAYAEYRFEDEAFEAWVRQQPE